MPKGEKKKKEGEGAGRGERHSLKGQNTGVLHLGEEGASLQTSKSSARQEQKWKAGS